MKLFFRALLFHSIVNTCAAQVPVSKEPRHHNILENKFVRLLDVHISPGDTTFFHKHETPSVFIVLGNAKTGSELISEGVTNKAPVTHGNIWFDGFYIKPRIHRVWNSDTVEFHVMDIELLNKVNDTDDLPVLQNSFKLLFNEKPVRVYLSALAPHSTIYFNRSKYPLLIIGLTDAVEVTIDTKVFKQKGDFIFIDHGEGEVLINNGNNKSELAILELK